MEAHGTAERIGGQLAALGELIDIDDAAAQYFRHLLGSDQRQLGKGSHFLPPCDTCIPWPTI